jgi:hypothetical protein
MSALRISAELLCTDVGELCNSIIYVSRRVCVTLFVMSEYDDGDFDRTEDRELMRFLKQTTFALQKCTVSRALACFGHQDKRSSGAALNTQ